MVWIVVMSIIGTITVIRAVIPSIAVPPIWNAPTPSVIGGTPKRAVVIVAIIATPSIITSIAVVSTPTIITTPSKVVIYIYDGLFRVISPTGISAFVIIDVLLNYCGAINIGTAVAIDIREDFICLSIFHCLI